MGQCMASQAPPTNSTKYDSVEVEEMNVDNTMKDKDRSNTHISDNRQGKRGGQTYQKRKDIIISAPKAPVSILRYASHSMQRIETIDEMAADESVMSPLSSAIRPLFKQESMKELILSDISEKKWNEYRMSEVSTHNRCDDIWIVINNSVYDVTDFWQKHPVNPQYVFKFGGMDCTDAFNSAGHSEYAKELCEPMKIGVLDARDRKKESRKMSVVNWGNLEQTNLDDFKDKIKISKIFVHPVKGCKGVELESTFIDQSGCFNDRMYCFVDSDTHNPINQLKYPKLALIQPILDKSMSFTEDMHWIKLENTENKSESIKVKTVYDKNEMVEIEYVNSDTKILSFDQGNAASEWITKYLHSAHDIKDKNKTFRFCKILRANVRPHKDYFSLPFIKKSDQPIKGVLNYSAINLASQESLDELNRRWALKYGTEKKELQWPTWRVNIVLSGLPKAHFEDFAKFLSIRDSHSNGMPSYGNNDEDEDDEVQLLWNRRRYLCTVPNVNVKSGIQTSEPQDTLQRYRNAITLNDTTAKPGKNGVFFGSFFLVKKGGQIKVGQSVQIRQTQFNVLRTNRQKSYYGSSNVESGNKNFSVKQLIGQYQKYELIKKRELTHDTIHLRFALADPSKMTHASLRLNIGGHYLLKIPQKHSQNEISVIRAYTPVILDMYEANSDKFFDLIVKVYENGAMTSYLQKMSCGDLIDGKQYYGGISNSEIGVFRFGDPSHYQIKHWTVNVSKIVMICGGTGIAPMMQILQSIHSNYLNGGIDNTQISVLYSNKTVSDILMNDLLTEMTENNENIKVAHVVTTTEDHPKNKNNNQNKSIQITQFGKRINADFITQYGFKPSDDCIVLLCGPPRMDIAMNKICRQIGFDDKHIHNF